MKKVALFTDGGSRINAETTRYLANYGYAIRVNYKQNKQTAELIPILPQDA